MTVAYSYLQFSFEILQEQAVDEPVSLSVLIEPSILFWDPLIVKKPFEPFDVENPSILFWDPLIKLR